MPSVSDRASNERDSSKLAELTGGEAYFTDDLATLDAEYHRVVEDLHRRYVLGLHLHQR